MKPELNQRVKVKDDALSTWKGKLGTVIRVDRDTQMALVDLDRDIKACFWWDELEEIANDHAKK